MRLHHCITYIHTVILSYSYGGYVYEDGFCEHVIELREVVDDVVGSFERLVVYATLGWGGWGWGGGGEGGEEGG
jgi:hypothetical protein